MSHEGREKFAAIETEQPSAGALPCQSGIKMVAPLTLLAPITSMTYSKKDEAKLTKNGEVD
jgi:hypothetical protein